MLSKKKKKNTEVYIIPIVQITILRNNLSRVTRVVRARTQIYI